MNNNKHLTILSILMIVYDSIIFLIGLGLLKGFSFLSSIVTDETAMVVLSYIGTGVGTFLLIISIPGIIAGLGLVYRKSWSRIFGLIVCAIKLLNLPFGTALGFYGFWVLMKDESIELLNK